MSLEFQPLKKVLVQSCQFEDILPIWQNELWPLRNSIIEKTSCINLNGDIDLDLSNSQSFFWKIEDNEKIVAVISCIHTSLSELRSRGIWVDKKYRELGLGRALMSELVLHAVKNNISTLWSMPRYTSLGFYLKCGFSIYGETEKYEFGPHFLVKKTVYV